MVVVQEDMVAVEEATGLEVAGRVDWDEKGGED